MFRKLHLQLTLLCIVVVTAILLSLSAVILHLVYKNEYLKCFQDFEKTMSAIYQDMSDQTSLSHSWLEETSAKYNLDISILDNGSPILFHRNTNSADMELLFSRARKIALDSYALSDLSAKSSNTLMHKYEKFEGLAIHKNIFFELSIPDEPLPQVFCDAERMTQVFTILFDNAISYTPKGGHILASISEAHNCFTIAVCDNGPGIPDETKKEIFLRFYRYDQSRTDKNHFGLGLSIAKEIIELHGGTILAGDSDEGGAKFTITLPIQKR